MADTPSIHNNRNAALVGVDTRKDCLLPTVKADQKIKDPRIEKLEQISARRFYHKVRISSREDFDIELNGWLKNADTLME